MRDASKARGVEHTGVFEQRATPLAAMQRRPNALFILRRALRHEESNILEYLSDEQRHWRRCSGGRMPWYFAAGP